MTKPWDYCMKTLISANPQAFVNWLVAGATFVTERSKAFRNCDFDMDSLLEIRFNGEGVLLEIEFQSSNDAEMPQRLLRYNVLARLEHKLPVHSFVIYLMSDGEIKPSPLNWITPIKPDILQFQFENIEVAKLSPEDILQAGSVGLLPLLPLTRGGATCEIVEKMLMALQQPEHNELALIGYTLAALVFKRTNLANLDWLARSFKKMDNLIHESPIYQMILQEGEIKGHAKGHAKGREEGLIEGHEKALRQAIVNIIQAHFPELKSLAAQQAATIKNVTFLNHLLVKISTAADAKEAHTLLLDLPKEAQEP